MALQTGTRLGPYEIQSALGAGGMGEVYRARDTRLNRDVAIKILPASYAREPDRLQRFEQEARTVAALNHPNILALYDIGAVDGSPYLVSELLQGGTLREQLVDGPLPVRKAIDYALQIAQGLAAAHDKGIVHRDLKPDNIFITKDSRVKILDFGLAKLARPEAMAAAAVDSAAITMSPTSAGVVVGTTGYMSPEQVRGQVVDQRSDIFNFGLVLYEMLAGRRAFRGDTSVETMTAILKEDPPALVATNGQVSAAVERIVWRCLEKQPEQRFQSAKDLGFALEAVAGKTSGSDAAVATPMASRRLRRDLLLPSALLLAVVVAGFAGWTLKPVREAPVIRAIIMLPAGQRLAGPDQPSLALSPDGKFLAYAAIQGSTQQLYLRPLDSLEAKPLTGTDGAYAPFFSPDGQWLGFFTSTSLKKFSVSGGGVQTFATVGGTFSRGATWGSDGIILFSRTGASGLYQIRESGRPAPVARLEKGGSKSWPELLPGSKAVVFATALGLTSLGAQIVAQSLASGELHNLRLQGSQPHYARSGHLIYAQGGNLMAVAFDPYRLEVTGTPTSVIEGVQESANLGATQYSISATGTLAYIAGPPETTAIQRKLLWVNRKGEEEPLPSPARAYRFPRLSPDSQHLAITIEEPTSDVWIYNLRRNTLTRLTVEGGANLMGAWTPDSRRVAFGGTSASEGPRNFFWQAADGTGAAERLSTGDYARIPNSFSPKGEVLAFNENNPDTGLDIWVLRLKDRKAEPLIRTTFNESAAVFSPDGNWLAYVSDESGRYEVYAQPYPGPGEQYPISTDGGTEPVWNRNGRELFYRSGNKMMAVDISTRRSFAAGKPRVLFEGQYLPTPGTLPNYDVSPDGQRFLMLKAGEQEQPATQINVVLNWFEELKKRVPAGKK